MDGIGVQHRAWGTGSRSSGLGTRLGWCWITATVLPDSPGCLRITALPARGDVVQLHKGILLALGCMVVGGALLTGVTARAMRPLGELVQAAQDISAGRRQ